MSHEGQMRRGKEEKARGLDTADTKYYDQQVKEGKVDPDEDTSQEDVKESLREKNHQDNKRQKK